MTSATIHVAAKESYKCLRFDFRLFPLTVVNIILNNLPKTYCFLRPRQGVLRRVGVLKGDDQVTRPSYLTIFLKLTRKLENFYPILEQTGRRV